MTLANKSQAGEATGVFKLTSSECKSEFTVKTVTDSSIVLTKKEGSPKCDLEDISLNLVSDNELRFPEDKQMYFAQGYREISLYKKNIPCKNEHNFKLNDHLYLENFDDPFVLPNKDNKERIARNDALREDKFFYSLFPYPKRWHYPDKFSNILRGRYHYYSTIPNTDSNPSNKICELTEKGCTPENVFAEMMSQAQFTAPPRKEQDYNPVLDCMVVDLDVDYQFDNFARFWYWTKGDKIVVMVNKENLIAINYTLPTHIFFPGRIFRQVIEKDGAVWVSTIGEGRGMLAPENEIGGKFIFSNIDDYFKEHVRDAIDKGLPWGLDANRK
ncbi:hypothetical protein [Moorena sp. SIO3H5]|uniref:hypothetical protein n=1 Tax=Moorena sp. SIO3H5 TaxID=2607834 RepID=UPI0013BE6A76|nr:hypothetical protein [Moorena sp. SIO3H5]NEO74066.1 hypothetical protein [Moorena sp. SIO3H5]